MATIPLFATYVAEVGAPLHREGHKTVSYGLAKQRIERLAASRAFDRVEVRVQLQNGSERLYAVLSKDGDLFHLRDVEGGDTVIPAHQPATTRNNQPLRQS